MIFDFGQVTTPISTKMIFRVINLLILSVAIFSYVSCSYTPPKNEVVQVPPTSQSERNLSCELIGLPTTATHKRHVSFKIRIRNKSSETVVIPIREEVSFTSSVTFIRDAPPGKRVSELMASNQLLSGDYAITSNSIHFSPPQFDQLKPGEFREYDFKWTPKKEDQGTGALKIELPYSFPEIPLQPMTIVRH